MYFARRDWHLRWSQFIHSSAMGFDRINGAEPQYYIPPHDVDRWFVLESARAAMHLFKNGDAIGGALAAFQTVDDALCVITVVKGAAKFTVSAAIRMGGRTKNIITREVSEETAQRILNNAAPRNSRRFAGQALELIEDRLFSSCFVWRARRC